jgi:hypothetical protein
MLVHTHDNKLAAQRQEQDEPQQIMNLCPTFDDRVVAIQLARHTGLGNEGVCKHLARKKVGATRKKQKQNKETKQRHPQFVVYLNLEAHPLFFH